jgi:8-oxo-dGTP diphosphatase
VELLYATGNPAKLASMAKRLKGLGIELVGLDGFSNLPDISESGASPLENARIKAMAYFKNLQRPLFSCDSGLYCRELPPELQPGVNVRRVNGRRLSDDEMIAYYGGLARRFGGRLTAYYRNAVCLVRADGTTSESDSLGLAGEPFGIVAEPHAKRVKGWPIDSLSVRLSTGAYYLDDSAAESLTDGAGYGAVDEAWRRFFIGALGLEPLKMSAVELGNSRS